MANKNYWAEREKNWSKKEIGKSMEFDEIVAEQFQDLGENIELKVYKFYSKYADDNGITMAQARQRVSQFDVNKYAKNVDKIIADPNISIEEKERLKLYNLTMKVNRLENLKSSIGVDVVKTAKTVNDLIDDELIDRMQRTGKHNAGILGEYIPKDMVKRMESIANSSYHGATYSARIWGDMDSLKYELDSILSRGMLMGENPNKNSQRLMKLVDKSVNNAKNVVQRLARTESSRVADEYSRQLYREQGYDKLEWIAEPTACNICKKLDGKVFEFDKTPECPAHPNCYCSVIPALDAEKEIPKPKQLETSKSNESGESENRNNHKTETKYTPTKIKSEKQFVDEMKKIGFNKVGTRGMSVDSMDKIYNKLGAFYNDYPQMTGYIKELEPFRRSKVKTVAAATLKSEDLTAGRINPVLQINTAMIDNFDEILQRNVDLGFWSKKSDYTGVIQHEVAHFINYKRTFAKYGIDVEQIQRSIPEQDNLYEKAINGVRQHEIDRELVKKAFDKAGLRYDVLENHEKYISKYGRSSPAETFAEALSDEDENNVLSNAFKQITKEELSKLDRTTKGIKR